MDENNLNNNEPQVEEYETVEAEVVEEKTEPEKSKWNNSPYATETIPVKPGNGMGIASMILGIISVISLVLCCIPFFCFIPLICGIPGLILGIIGMKNCTKSGYAVAGIVMSAVSIALAVIALVFVIIFSVTGVLDEMMRDLEYTMYI